MRRRSVYPVEDGRSRGGRSRVMVGVEIVMTSGTGSGSRGEQECMILLTGSSVRDSDGGAHGSPGTI